MNSSIYISVVNERSDVVAFIKNMLGGALIALSLGALLISIVGFLTTPDVAAGCIGGLIIGLGFVYCRELELISANSDKGNSAPFGALIMTSSTWPTELRSFCG